MGSCEERVEVMVKRREVMTAVLPVTESRLALSNLDLLLPPLEVGIFLCYANSGIKNNEMMLSSVRKGLRQVLVPFNALAGEVVLNDEGEPELLCNNRGVDFVEAFADINLRELDINNPDVSIRDNFVPVREQGVLTVQVTEMKCGGVVIGCNFDHRVADAHSINKFLVAWADLSRSSNIQKNETVTLFKHDQKDHTTFYQHPLVKPRQPSHYDAAINDMYVPIKEGAACNISPPSFELKSRIYHVDALEIEILQALAGPKRSKLESFSALLWKLLAKSSKDDEKRSKLGIVVNGRKCLSNDSSISMENHFGNVLSIPYSDASVGELKSLPLFEIANAVHACVERAANEEHFRGLVDWVEDRRPQRAMSRIYSYLPSESEEPAVVVSSGQRFPVTQLDFGCGIPDFASYYFPWGGCTGYVMPMPSAKNNGDWIVFMHLAQKHLDFVEKEAPEIFKPFVF